MAACRYFQQGRCLNGDACSFQHAATVQQLNAAAIDFSPGQRTVPPSRAKPPCSFFQRGRCTRGTSCPFEHDIAGLRGPATITDTKAPCSFFQRGLCTRGTSCPFRHEVGLQDAVEIKDTRSTPICTFFARNACKKGKTCEFRHENDPLQGQDHIVRPDSVIGVVSDFQDPAKPMLPGQTFSDEQSDSSILGAATVTFGDGVVVSEICLPSDFSSIQLANLPLHHTVRDTQDLLATHGFPGIGYDSIHMHNIDQTGRKSAVIKIRDADFATTFLQRSGASIQIGGSPVTATSLQTSGASKVGSNRLQLTSVECTWHRPSRVAFIRYPSEDLASRAVRNIQKDRRKLKGRIIDARIQRGNGYHMNCSVNVGNLHPETTSDDLRQYLAKPSPGTITMGPCSHSKSSMQLEEYAKAELEKCGTLIDWILVSPPSSLRVKIIAKFTDPEAARKAAKEMNGNSLDPISKDTMHVALIVSIKISVLRRKLAAVRSQIEALAEVSRRDTDYVGIKMYESHEKETAHVRIYGQTKQSVALAKAKVEKILAGHIATQDDSPISNPFFFQRSSTGLMEEIMKEHDVYIHRDFRKSVLRVFGAPRNIKPAQDALLAHASRLADQEHVIILDAESLRNALKGAFRLIVESVGKENAKIDITSTPKRILIHGSESHLTRAQEILRSYDTESLEQNLYKLSIGENEDEALCPVCWTPPEEPTQTHCGHVYCASCLISQCNSTSKSDFPIRCLGNSAACSAVLRISELKQILPGNDYETMLQASLDGFIRGNPKDFQYCPTPDCDRFYRTTPRTSPRNFDCDGCLTSVCTGCSNEVHDGLSCDAHAAFLKAATDGMEEFAKWKEEHDVKDCPNCKTTIEKNEGCNHMECKWCSIHICWFCMDTFKTGPETYEHMQRGHSAFG